jgi:hypothetical protein
MIIDLLSESDTTFIGVIGENIAWKYLGKRLHSIDRFLDNRLIERLKKTQIQYIESLFREGKKWSFDFISLRGSYKNPEPYLIEVKTSRPGKRKRGLKGNWTRRSRGKWTKEDIEEAKKLGFRLLIVNVQLLDDWKFEVTERQL